MPVLCFFPLSFVCYLEMPFVENTIGKQVPLEKENYSQPSRTPDLTATCIHMFSPFF